MTARHIWTVVVWDQGDARVRPVGPTSHDPSLLGATRMSADLAHDRAEIVPWSSRAATVAQIVEFVRARETERLMMSADDAVDDARDAAEIERGAS